MKTYSASDYLRQVLCPDLLRMCDAGFPFYAYVILCQSLELVGALFDTKNPFDAKGLSEDRFARGVKEVYSHQKYAKCRKELYGQLRGSLVHQVRPGERFVLASRKTGAPEAVHLSETGDCRIVLVIEVLVEDLQRRLEVILSENSKWRGMLDLGKIDGAFLAISEPEDFTNFPIGSVEFSSQGGGPDRRYCSTYKSLEEY